MTSSTYAYPETDAPQIAVLTERQLRVSEADLAVSEFSVLQAKIAALLALSTCNLP